MPELQNLSLTSIEGGAAVEMFDRALTKVAANVADINTTLATRQIVLKLKIKPGRDRCSCELDLSVNTALAGQEPIKSTVFIEEDGDGNRALYGRKAPQLDIPFEVRKGGQG